MMLNRVRVLSLVLALVLGASLAPPPKVDAQVQGGCMGNLDTSSMAGSFDGVTMFVRMYSCGGLDLTWCNTYGCHLARYAAFQPIPGGGFYARLTQPDPIVGSLDGQMIIGFKPAEPGWVQVLTVPSPTDVRLYRLRKVG